MKKMDEFEQICFYCEYSQPMTDDDYCLCSKKGVVSLTYHCRYFCFDLLKLPISLPTEPKIGDEDNELKTDLIF